MEELKVICREEIAFEGLDGITLESLWFRLQDLTPSFPLPIDEYTKPFIWELVSSLDDVSFYELPTARPPIKYADEGKEYSEQLATYVCFEQVELAPVDMINDEANGVRGCCSTYYTRKDITSDVRPNTGNVLTYNDVVTRYADKFVIVASQETRLSVLIGPTGNSKYDFTNNSYCILEYIGKARSNGRLQTEISSAFNIEAKASHYVRNRFTIAGMVKIQHLSYFIKSSNSSKSGVLILLSRFQNKLLNSYQYLMEEISNFLEQQPEKEARLSVVREQLLHIMKNEYFLDQKRIKKMYELLQNTGLTKFYMRPHKEVYGVFAEDKDTVGLDRQVRVVKLLKTYKEYIQEMEEDHCEDDMSMSVKKDQTIAEQPLILQVYSLMRTGVSKPEISKHLQLTLVEVQRFINKLERDKHIETYVHSEGKYKYKRFITIGHGEPNFSQSQKATKEEIREVKIANIKQQKTLQNNSDKQESSETKVATIDPTAERSTINLKQLISIKENRRRKIILQELEQNNIVNGPHCLRKLILQQEKSKGCIGVCDRRTIFNLLKRMQSDGLVNIIQTLVPTSDDKPPLKLMLITLPTISEDDERVLSLIKSLKFKAVKQNTDYEIKSRSRLEQERKKKIKRLKKIMRKVGKHATDEEVESSGKEVTNAPVIRKPRRILEIRTGPPSSHEQQTQGYMRKMARAKIIYHYIWYLVYAHPQRFQSSVLSIDDLGMKETKNRKAHRKKHSKDLMENADQVPGITQAKSPEKSDLNELKEMVNETCADDTMPTISSKTSETLLKDSSVKEVTGRELTVYCEDMSEEMYWKRFLPPLPRYSQCVEGWCYVTDIIMIMPLGIFCNLVMLTVKIPNLQEYLNDPIKRCIPLMFLPQDLQHQLCYHRKYIHSIHNSLQRLCQMGLLTFGPPQNFFDKDQVFCFLHQKASIVDTTSCQKHYNEVSEGTYVTERYTLNRESTVLQFFRDLQVICLNTPLGLTRRREDEPLRKTSEEEVIMIKELHKNVKNVTIIPEDTGKIPGNGRGAAGLDSRMYAHLRKNWSLPTGSRQAEAKRYNRRHRKRTDRLKSIKNHHKGKKSGLKGVVTVEIPKGHQDKNKGGRGLKRPKSSPDTKVRKKAMKRVQNVEKPSESIGPRSKMILKRARYDWTDEQDKMLLIFQAASMILAKKRPGFFIAWRFRRDLLQKYYPNSTQKTTSGIMRRCIYLLKSPANRMLLAINLGQLQNDEVINEALKIEVDSEKSEACEKEYTDMVELILQRLRLGPMNNQQLPLTLGEFHEQYDIFRTPEILKLLPRYKIPQQVQWKTTDLKEIKKLVVRKAVLASFFMIERPVLFNPSQAFYVFNQFNEEFLVEVVGALKEAYLTTRNRFRHKIRRVLPCTAMSLQVSNNCRRSFNSLISTDVLKEVYKYMMSLDEQQYDLDIESDVPINANCGQVACFASMLCCNMADYSIEVPDQVIVLDNSFIKKGTLERTSKLIQNPHDSSDDSDVDADKEQLRGYPLYRRVTRIQHISHAVEEMELDQRNMGELEQETAPDVEKQEQNQVAAKVVNTEHSYTQMLPAERSEPVPVEITVDKNLNTTDKELKKMKQQDPRVFSTRTDWFLLQGLGDEGISEETTGMLDAIMLKPCKSRIRLRKQLKDNIHRFNGKTYLAADDHHNILDSREDFNVFSVKEDFIDFIGQERKIDNKWTNLEYFERTKFIPVPLMKKTSMDDIIRTLSDEESTVFGVISDKKHLGLLASELVAATPYLSFHTIIENLHKLMIKQLIFRVGLDDHRYVAVNFCDLWSISSANNALFESSGPPSKVRPNITKETFTTEVQEATLTATEEVLVDDTIQDKETEVTSFEVEVVLSGDNSSGENKMEICGDDSGVKVDIISMNVQNENTSAERDKAIDNDNIIMENIGNGDVDISMNVQNKNTAIEMEKVKGNDDIRVENTRVADVDISMTDLPKGNSKQGNIKDNSSHGKLNQISESNTQVESTAVMQSQNEPINQNKSSELKTRTGNKKDDSGIVVEKMTKGKKRKRKMDNDRMISADNIVTKDAEIQFIPQQWYNTGGQVERDELVRLIQKLGLIIVSKPGIPEKHIIKQLHLVLSPVECKEILEMLQQAGCITKHLIPKLPSPYPFNNATSSDTTHNEYYYNPTQDCMLRLAAYEMYKTTDGEETAVEEQEDQPIDES